MGGHLSETLKKAGVANMLSIRQQQMSYEGDMPLIDHPPQLMNVDSRV